MIRTVGMLLRPLRAGPIPQKHAGKGVGGTYER